MQKVPFCKLEMSLNRKFFKIFKHSADFFKCIFTILLQIQHENNFLPIPVDTDKAKFLWYLFVRLLLLSLKFRVPKKVSKQNAILAPVKKQ